MNEKTRSIVPNGTNLSVGSEIIRGIAWNIVGTVLKQGITLLSAIVIARLLTPEDYALGGISLAITGFLTTLTQHGFAQALVQQDKLSERMCHSVFWVLLAGGITVSVITVSLAPMTARFYSAPSIKQAMPAVTLILLSGMVGAVPNALLQRRMQFREINLIGIASGFASAIAGVLLAWLGYGFWALLAPVVGVAIITALGETLISRYTPARVFSWSDIRLVGRFGLSQLASNIVLYFNENSDYLIMGKIWAPVDFGLYYFAFQRSRQPFGIVMGQIATVILPGFSQIQNDHERLRKAFLLGTKQLCMVVFPMYTLLIAFAGDIIPWVFGKQWQPSVGVFQILALYAFALAISALVPGTLLAINRPQALLAFNVFRASVILPVLIVLGTRGASITLVSVTLLLVWLIQLPFFVGYLFRCLHITFMDAWRNFRRVALSTTVMALSLLINRKFGFELGMSQWQIVLIMSSIGLCLFGVMMKSEIRTVVQQFRQSSSNRN